MGSLDSVHSSSQCNGKVNKLNTTYGYDEKRLIHSFFEIVSLKIVWHDIKLTAQHAESFILNCFCIGSRTGLMIKAYLKILH